MGFISSEMVGLGQLNLFDSLGHEHKHTDAKQQGIKQNSQHSLIATPEKRNV